LSDQLFQPTAAGQPVRLWDDVQLEFEARLLEMPPQLVEYDDRSRGESV
jgi:hypothetical protein